MQQSLIDSFAMSAQWTIGAFVDDVIRSGEWAQGYCRRGGRWERIMVLTGLRSDPLLLSDGVVDAARRDCDLLLDVDKSLESRKVSVATVPRPLEGLITY